MKLYSSFCLLFLLCIGLLNSIQAQNPQCAPENFKNLLEASRTASGDSMRLLAGQAYQLGLDCEEPRYQMEAAMVLSNWARQKFLLDSLIGFIQLVEPIAIQLQDTSAWLKAIDLKTFYYDYRYGLDSSLKHYEEGMELAEIAKDYSKLATLCKNLGTVYADYDVDLSIKWVKKALYYAEKESLTKVLCNSFASLGSIYQIKGNNDSALYFLKRAQETCQTEGMLRYLVYVYLESALLFEGRRQMDSSLYYALKMESLADSIELTAAIINAKSYLVHYYFDKDDFETAIPYCEELVRLHEENPDHMLARTYDQAGVLYGKTGDLEKSLLYLGKAMKEVEQAGNKRMIMRLSYSHAYVYHFNKRYSDALQPARKGLALSEEIRDQDGMLRLLWVLGSSEFEMGQYAGARRNLTRAVGLLKDHQDVEMEELIYRALARTDSARGDMASAYQYQLKRQAASDTIRQREFNESLAEMETRYETQKREAEILALETAGELKDQLLAQANRERNLYLLLALVLALGGTIIVALYLRLRKNREALQGLNATKDRLFSIIAHDLRGPLTGFQNLEKIFRHYIEKQDFSRLEKMGQQVSTQARQLKDMLDNLLNWSLQQLGAYQSNEERFSLAGLGTEIVDMYQENAQAKGNQIKLEIPPQFELKADRNGLSIVLNNLMANANKFTQNGEIVLKAVPLPQKVQISVSDTGVGMDPDELKNWEKAHLLQSSRGTAGEKGTGIGLKIVQQLVDRWNGQFSIHSKKAEGTRMEIELPLLN